jgi:nickel/cobalt transporter (NicO) family protein
MGSVFELQRWLYGEAVAALDGLATSGLTGAPTLVAAAFAFGFLHAFLPGHGKMVMTARFAGDGGALAAIASTSLLILVHVGSAIVIAIGGFAVITRTIGGAGRAPALELASSMLVTGVGLWLLWRALRPRKHRHEGRGFALAIAAGLIPCPLTFFIMSYAIPRGMVWPGLALAACFAIGMIVTVAAFPLIAVLLRTRLTAWMTRTEPARARTAKAISVAAAVAIIAIGVAPWVGGVGT